VRPSWACWRIPLSILHDDKSRPRKCDGAIYSRVVDLSYNIRRLSVFVWRRCTDSKSGDRPTDLRPSTVRRVIPPSSSLVVGRAVSAAMSDEWFGDHSALGSVVSCRRMRSTYYTTMATASNHAPPVRRFVQRHAPKQILSSRRRVSTLWNQLGSCSISEFRPWTYCLAETIYIVRVKLPLRKLPLRTCGRSFPGRRMQATFSTFLRRKLSFWS